MRRVRGVEVVGTSVGLKENKENAVSLKQTHYLTSFYDICSAHNLRARSWNMFVGGDREGDESEVEERENGHKGL